jgi:hypothetical protein
MLVYLYASALGGAAVCHAAKVLYLRPRPPAARPNSCYFSADILILLCASLCAASYRRAAVRHQRCQGTVPAVNVRIIAPK